MVDPGADKTIRLTPMDLTILFEHFPCFRVSTYRALHRCYWPDRPIDAVKKWVGRMTHGGLIAGAPLYDNTQYYYLTEHATRMGNQPERLARPLSPFLLAQAFGILAFSLLGEKTFRKIPAAEFESRFPDLSPAKLDGTFYYHDPDYQDDANPAMKRIGYLIVDSGRRVRDIVARFRKSISQRLAFRSWRELIERRRFVIGIVTTAEGKANRLRAALDPIRRNVLLRIEVREELRFVVPLRTPHVDATDRRNQP